MPTKMIGLDGMWRFAMDPEDVGIQKGWFNSTLLERIRLPGTTDEAGIGGPGPERLGVLTRRHEYIGPAWYQREIKIPATWADREVDLFLERVLWQSRVWINGQEKGETLDALGVPHVHQLGQLTPGRHVLTLRIDNRMIHPLGEVAHSYGHQMQTVWNGVVGRIKLQAQPAQHIDQVRVFTEHKNNTWSVDVEVKVSGRTQDLSLAAHIINPKTRRSVSNTVTGLVSKDGGAKLNLKPIEQPIAWTEFSPKLYKLVIELRRGAKIIQTITERFGFRDIRHDGNRLLLNGVPVFMRGNLDCIHFPMTGYPSTEKKDWLKIFRIYQQHNLNHVRFHSWCPPEATFEAADELGLYIQAEAGIWISKRAGGGKGPGMNDPIDTFIQAEMRRIVDTFGNHPSFVLMAIGNELGDSNFKVTGQWIKEIKTYDPRRLYAASTARTITPFCDFSATHHVQGIGPVRKYLVNNTAWDYEHQYGRTKVPIIAHEIGQWPVYPDWSLCEKCSGVLRNTRLETMLEKAKQAGVFTQQENFTRASGAMNALLYKDEIESFLRTPSCRGFQLLSMQDFHGQGEAYCGWLDMFWGDKGTTKPKVFRGYCAPVVALAKLPKYIFKTDETLNVPLLVRNDGPVTLKNVGVHCRIRDASGMIRYRTKMKTAIIERGDVRDVGSLSVPLLQVVTGNRAERLTLELRLDGKKEPNSYPLWIYPVKLPRIKTSDMIVTSVLDNHTISSLKKGATVFLDAHDLGDPVRQKELAAWRSIYWSLVCFPGQNQTLGLLVQDKHPAFGAFPTEFFNNWQWWGICEGAHGFDLTDHVPADYRLIAQPVPDFHANRKIGSIFEFKVGKGKLLVCGYNLSKKRCEADPAVRQLRYSLMRYVTGSKFAPSREISLKALGHCSLFLGKRNPPRRRDSRKPRFTWDLAEVYEKTEQYDLALQEIERLISRGLRAEVTKELNAWKSRIQKLKEAKATQGKQPKL